MATPAVAALWQHPFVDVFKYAVTVRMETMTRGDVEQLVDKLIRKNVYRLRGKIAASNYLRIPKDIHTLPSMHLTGRFVYMELRRMQSNSVTFHFEVSTKKKTTLRLTFSTMYSNVRSMGINLRVPLTLTDKWTVVALDMLQLLDLHTSASYNREGFDALKTIVLCSSMYVRGVYTSDILYIPETLPKAMKFPLVKPMEGGVQTTNTWDATYDWRWLPQLPCEPTSNAKSSLSINHSHDIRDCVRSPSRTCDSPESKGPSPPAKSPRCSPTNRPKLTFNPTTADDNEAQLEASRARVLDKADMILKKAGIHRTSPPKSYVKAKYEPSGVYTPTKYGNHAGFRAANPVVWPSPALTLRRVIGYSVLHRRALAWASASSMFFYASESTVIVGRRDGQPSLPSSSSTTSPVAIAQEFLLGHTDNVTALAYSPTASLLVSAQGGLSPRVRIWLLTPKGHCIASVKAHAQGVDALSFSRNGTQLCGVGKDYKRRTQILVWDVATPTQPVLVAKQLCDYSIANMKFSPHEHDRLVSCGRESIRFWRVKAGHLPGCPVILHEYARDTWFTDLDFDPVVMGNQPNRPLYVASSHGTVLVIDYDSMALTCVYKLHNGPIHCLRVNEGFCVTGSEDGYIRVWPLDFSDFYLEAAHEAPVACLDLSVDGLHALIGCENGTIGVLEIGTQRYTSVVRAHTSSITAITLSPRSDSFVSTSKDGTIRMWDIATGTQTYEFQMQDDMAATAIAYHPRKDVLAVGFASGMLRLFDIPTMQVQETYQQHRGRVASIVYGRSACYSTGADDQQLCCYQAHATTVHMVNCSFPTNAPDKGRLALHMGLKLLAVVGKDASVVELRDMYTLRVVRLAQGKHQPLRLLGFVEAQVVALETTSQRVVFFCAATGSVHQTFPALCSGGPMGDVAFTATGRYAFTGRIDQPHLHAVMLETSTQLRAVQLFPGQASGVAQVGLCADGQTLVSCGAGSAVYVWSFHGPAPDQEAGGAQIQEHNVGDNNLRDEASSDDDTAFYDLPQPVVDNNDNSDDTVDSDEVPNLHVPTPMQPPIKEREVLQPVTRSMECLHHHTVGWNMPRHHRPAAAPPVIVWSSVTGHIVAAAGSTLLIESPLEKKQTTVQHHKSDVIGLCMSHDEAFVASFDLDSVVIWRIDPWELIVAFSWPADSMSNFVVWRPDGLHVLGVATKPGETTLLLWNVQESALVARVTTQVTIGQVVWAMPPLNEYDTIQGREILFFTSVPLQGWVVSSSVLEPVSFSHANAVSLVQTSSELPHCVLLYSASDHTVSFFDVRSQTITGAVSTLRRRHVVRHMHWVHPYLIVATDTAPCLWVYVVHLDSFTLSLHTSRTPDDLEIHTVRLDHAIAFMSWNDRAQGLVQTTNGSLWFVEAESHTKQLLRRIHDSAVECIQSSSTHVVTLSGGHTIRLWSTASLDQVAAVTTPDGGICVDVNAAWCVVGFQDGSFRVYDIHLTLVYASRGDEFTRTTATPSSSPKSPRRNTTPTLPPPIQHLLLLDDSASVLVASASGRCVMFNVPTKHVQPINLPFGGATSIPVPPNALASQIKIHGSLVSLQSGGLSTWLAVWQSAASDKCYANVFTNVTTTQDAWELVGASRPYAASTIFCSAALSTTLVLYSARGAVEGRCFVQRQVLFRMNVDVVPTMMQVHGHHVLCRGKSHDNTDNHNMVYVLDVANESIHQAMSRHDHSVMLLEDAALVAVSGQFVVVCQGNRIAKVELVVGTTELPRPSRVVGSVQLD
ncbi:hypothetical protein H310_11027 [Aphanomyces invadans]|uniref:CFA20 domain-containing protein n=1 Tax=Aphanomyces invadans TaxID=157072 RepID=A0A024TNJ4_9STRA|nr:hypothetical protein H310_11027 [Aphanomyces invadans]ETV95593.1 hypothetical protein H310_11027 [Aphanomyces invadans]|eukprot:XP_008875786.1 hypothetical protein H310_11027 [Aphanomyces invadans]